MKTKVITQKVLVLLKIIGQTILIFAATMLLFTLFFAGIRGLNKTAHISVAVDDIKEIHNLRAAGIFACFVDDYYFDSTDWSFHGNIIVQSLKEGDLEVKLSSGDWVKVNEILLQSEDNSEHKLRTPQLNLKGRVDYEIITGSSMNDYEDINFDSELTYLNHTSEDYAYTITAPIMSVDVYWESEEGADSEYLEVEVEGASVSLNAMTSTEELNTIASKKFRIRTVCSYDRKVGGYWQIASFNAFSQHKDGRVKFSINPISSALSEPAGATVLRATYLSELKATLKGEASFRYAINSKDYALRNELLYFKVDDKELKEEMSKVTRYGYIGFDYDNGTATLGERELSYPRFVVNTTVDQDEKKRVSTFEYDAHITDALINEISLFPNFVALMSENWVHASVISVIVSVALALVTKKNEGGQVVMQTSSAKKTDKKKK